ncbi:hypothetical protein DOY81_010826 [Sarcophaga bullata]|nr:hypothetical protein DOY81_010826 [Sarcophaga bullata]
MDEKRLAGRLKRIIFAKVSGKLEEAINSRLDGGNIEIDSRDWEFARFWIQKKKEYKNNLKLLLATTKLYDISSNHLMVNAENVKQHETCIYCNIH